MADLIQLRRDLAANWTAENPILAQGEIGLELDTGYYKVGDGSTAWNSLGYFDKDNVGLSQVNNAKQQVWHGFPNNPYEVVLSYDATARQVTLTPTGATFDIWLNGVKFTKTGAQTSTAHANTTGNYFIVYGADGELSVSSDPWDILGAGIPVCYVYYNATLVDGIPLFELHTAKANRSWHKSQHFALGTYIRSGLEVADYTLNSAVDASLTYSIASGIVVDEDIEMTLSALADGGPYTIMRRTGANNWTWTTNNAFPYLFTTNGYIQYNQNNAGSYQMTEAAASRWVNYFVFATTAIPHTLTNGAPVSSSDKRFLIVPSQTVHTSLASAQGESLASLSWGGILIPEIVGAWKWTYETKSNNATTGKVQIVEVSRLTLTRSQLSGNFTAGSHNALTGRDAAESHPATAISNAPAGNIAATTVQAAINELDTEKLPNTTSLTEIGADLVDADEIPVYDASATANRKSLLSRIWNYIQTKFGAAIASERIPFSDGTQLTSSDNLTWIDADKTLVVQGSSQVATAGSELLTNNSFVSDLSGWTATGWTWSAGGAQNDASNTNALIRSGISVTNLVPYQIVITISGRTTGSVTVALGTAVYASSITATSTIAILANTTDSVAFSITPTSDFNGKIDEVSLKALTASKAIYSIKDENGSLAGEVRVKSSLLNTAVGKSSLSYNTTGINNTAVGFQALWFDTTGASNTAVGMNAMVFNTTGYDNVAVGAQALQTNTTGSYNTAIGYKALLSLTTGQYNTAIGSSALEKNTTGSSNFALGHGSLQNNTSGSQNTGIGIGTLYTNTGTGNIAIGIYAAFYETGSNKLYIENSDSASPLIYGEFDNDMVRINGMLYARKTTEQFRLEYDATKFLSATVDSSGNVTLDCTGNTIYTPDTIENTTNGAGIILKSPDGTRYRLTVANGGTLSIAAA